MGALLRVPFLEGHVAGARRREAQMRPLHLLAREDSVAGGEDFVQVGLGNVLYLPGDERHVTHTVQREAADVVAKVAPRVQVPIVAVVNEALRRDFPLGDLVLRTIPVLKLEALAAQHGGKRRAGSASARGAVRRRRSRECDGELRRRSGRPSRATRQPCLQGLHVRAEQARLQALEQVLHREQRLCFARIEPQAGSSYSARPSAAPRSDSRSGRGPTRMGA